MTQRSLEDCLFSNDGIGRMSAQARRLMKLQRVLEQALPPGLAHCTRLANLKPGVAVLHAPNGALATKLRQLLPRLTESFRNEGVDLNEIRVKVQPVAQAWRPAQVQTPAVLGIQQKQGLTSLAASLPQDSPLRAALTRLVSRAAGAKER